MLELWLLACGTSAPAPPAHYAAFDRLVDVAARGDLPAAKALARDLGGDDDDEALASALGFVQVASDRSELADGVAEAARACGGCHAAGVAPPARPPYDHAHAARWAAWALVWDGALAPPPSEDARLPPFAAALAGDGVPAERVARAVTTCADCHAR